MNENDILIIERYFRSELTDAEQLAFDQRLAVDAEFREEVRIRKMAWAAIRMRGREIFKQKLSERPLIKKPRKISYRPWAGLFMFLAIICAILFSIPDKPDETRRPPVDTAPIDTAKPRELVAITVKDTSPSPSTPPKTNINTEKLYAEAYQPYKEDSGTTLGSGPKPSDSSDLANIKRLKLLAKEEKYKESLLVYEQLSQELKEEDIALFYQANSLLALRNTEGAATLFNDLASNPNGDYASQAQWYSALCALKNKKLPDVKKWLEMITAKDSHASEELRKKANALMGKLK